MANSSIHLYVHFNISVIRLVVITQVSIWHIPSYIICKFQYKCNTPCGDYSGVHMAHTIIHLCKFQYKCNTPCGDHSGDLISHCWSPNVAIY